MTTRDNLIPKEFNLTYCCRPGLKKQGRLREPFLRSWQVRHFAVACTQQPRIGWFGVNISYALP